MRLLGMRPIRKKEKKNMFIFVHVGSLMRAGNARI